MRMHDPAISGIWYLFVIALVLACLALMASVWL